LKAHGLLQASGKSADWHPLSYFGDDPDIHIFIFK